MTATNEPL